MRNSTRLLRLAVGLSITLGFTSLAACGASSGDSSDQGQVRLAINNTSASLAAVVADKQGFFKKEGLNVKSTVMTDISKIPPTLGHQYDIGFGVQPLMIRASTQGLDIAMISGNEYTTEQKPEVLVIARPGAGIKTAADLAGKRLAAPALTGNLHLGTLYWIKQAGADPNSVKSVQVATPSMLDQLKSGTVDAAELQQPFANLAIKAGMVSVGYPFGPIGEPAQLSSWIASNSWAHKNGSTVTEFRAALDDAKKWIEANPSEAKAILAQFTGLDPAVVAASPLPEFTTDNSATSVQQWDKVMRSVSDLKAKVDYDKLVVNP